MIAIRQYWRSIFYYGVVVPVVLTTVAVVSTNGNVHNGAPVQQPTFPTSSIPREMPTVTPTPTPPPAPTAMPTSTPATLPSVTLPPSTVVTTPIVIVMPPTVVPTLTLTPIPIPVATPHNKAHGLKDGCLVQKKKWLLRLPCHPVHKNESIQ